LTKAYQLQIGVDFPIILFAVHTFYGLLMKLLAKVVIVAQGGLGDSFIGSLTRSELRTSTGYLRRSVLSLWRQKEDRVSAFFADAWPKVSDSFAAHEYRPIVIGGMNCHQLPCLPGCFGTDWATVPAEFLIHPQLFPLLACNNVFHRLSPKM
jgi:hypothetical protein